jgi:hypothetical protein
MKPHYERVPYERIDRIECFMITKELADLWEAEA